MKRQWYLGFFLVVGLALVVFEGVRAQTPLGSAFTYQGQILFNGVPVDDVCAATVTLWDDPTSTLPANEVGVFTPPMLTVTNGVFTTELDFGFPAFDGEKRWLELFLTCQNTGPAQGVTLQPRNELTATPYALFSNQATQQAGTCCDDLSDRFDNAFRVRGTVMSAAASGGTSIDISAPLNKTRYITGVRTRYLDGPLGNDVLLKINGVVVVWFPSTDDWRSAGGAPIRIEAGAPASLSGTVPDPTERTSVLVTGYDF